MAPLFFGPKIFFFTPTLKHFCVWFFLSPISFFSAPSHLGCPPPPALANYITAQCPFKRHKERPRK